MLGFLSKTRDKKDKVTSGEIYFVSCPDILTSNEIKMKFSKKAKEFAEKLNLNKVFLHFGKEIIEYDIDAK